MPGSPDRLIDFAAVRALISIQDVLKWASWNPRSVHGHQCRGPCPLCESQSRRTFSVHLKLHSWHCFACGRHGNQLDLWSHLTGLDLYRAAISLCQHAGKPVPLRRPLQSSDRSPDAAGTH
jgi:DNA primase